LSKMIQLICIVSDDLNVRRGNNQVMSAPSYFQHEMTVWGWGLTEPIERKKPKVAALLSMYCDRVDIAPLGPAPPLRESSRRCTQTRA